MQIQNKSLVRLRCNRWIFVVLLRKIMLIFQKIYYKLIKLIKLSSVANFVQLNHVFLYRPCANFTCKSFARIINHFQNDLKIINCSPTLIFAAEFLDKAAWIISSCFVFLFVIALLCGYLYYKKPDEKFSIWWFLYLNSRWIFAYGFINLFIVFYFSLKLDIIWTSPQWFSNFPKFLQTVYFAVILSIIFRIYLTTWSDVYTIWIYKQKDFPIWRKVVNLVPYFLLVLLLVSLSLPLIGGFIAYQMNAEYLLESPIWGTFRRVLTTMEIDENYFASANRFLFGLKDLEIKNLLEVWVKKNFVNFIPNYYFSSSIGNDLFVAALKNQYELVALTKAEGQLMDLIGSSFEKKLSHSNWIFYGSIIVIFVALIVAYKKGVSFQWGTLDDKIKKLQTEFVSTKTFTEDMRDLNSRIAVAQFNKKFDLNEVIITLQRHAQARRDPVPYTHFTLSQYLNRITEVSQASHIGLTVEEKASLFNAFMSLFASGAIAIDADTAAKFLILLFNTLSAA